MGKLMRSKTIIFTMVMLLIILAVGCEKEEANMDVTAELEATVKEDTTDIVITTNAIDGSVFEVYIMDSKLNISTDFVTAENGLAKVSLDNDPNWEPGYLEVNGAFKFNLINHPQPEHVQEVYGEYGEKLSGEAASANNKGGYNIDIKKLKLAYPNEELAKEEETEKVEENVTITIKSYIDDVKTASGVDLDWRDVEYNIPNNLDTEFVIVGEASLSNYFNYGYSHLEEEFFNITMETPESKFSERWHLYLHREDWNDLFEYLKEGDAFIGVTASMESDLYTDRQGRMALVYGASW